MYLVDLVTQYYFFYNLTGLFYRARNRTQLQQFFHLTFSSLNLALSSSPTTSHELLSQFSTEYCHVLVNQFHGNFRSKTPSCWKIKPFSRDVKWCFNASWGLVWFIFHCNANESALLFILDQQTEEAIEGDGSSQSTGAWWESGKSGWSHCWWCIYHSK